MPTNSPVVGTDGQPPIYQPDARWCWWSLEEIYRGQQGANKYIPKVKDYVMDTDTYTAYRVEALDPVTYIPTLKEVRPANMDFVFTETDVLFGVGPGTQADTYRVYLDTSEIPYSLAVDARLRVGGTMCAYAKIFRGAAIDGEGEVISKVYNSNGQFVSENVPLEVVALDSHTNYSIKAVPPCKTTTQMPNGEIVTAVFYASNDTVVSKRQLLVENSSFIRSVDASAKYITGIRLESPFMSPTIDKQIDYPLNVPMNALNLMGVVMYSDGSELKLPVDGTKFTMFGLDQYVSTIIGQKLNLVLRYAMAPNETSYSGVNNDGNHYVTESYDLVTVNPNNSYSVKLFGYPYWVDAFTGYQMRWWMMNLDRNIWFDVTGKVSFNANTGPYDPKGYGILQRKSVSVNLKDVSGVFKNFIHTQLVEIVLNGPPNGVATPWTVSHESNATRPFYGQDLFAKMKSANTVNLSSGITDYNEWKTRVYQNTFPLVNPASELAAPTPTHFIVDYLGLQTTYGVEDWNQDINVGSNVQGAKTLSIRFIKRVGNTDQQLAVAAMIINP